MRHTRVWTSRRAPMLAARAQRATIALLVMATFAGCGDGDGHPSTAVAPAECSAPEVCLEGRCVPIDACEGSCVRPSVQAESTTTCTLTRHGFTPFPTDTGLFDRVRLTEVTECVTAETLRGDQFRRTGACRVRTTETTSLVFCEGVVLAGQPCCPVECNENPTPERCRVVIAQPDGSTETEACPATAG